MNVSQNARVRFFIAAYTAVFVALAACGYLVIHERIITHETQSLAGGAIITDMAYYDLPRIMVSVNTGSVGMPPRLRADISLEVARKDMLFVANRQPRITEKLSRFLSDMKPEELASSQAVPELRADMLRMISGVVAPVPVHDLMFRELVVM